MTGDELRQWAKAHGHTWLSLADALDVNEKTLRRYAVGAYAVPRVVELALRDLSRSERARKAARARWSGPSP